MGINSYFSLSPIVNESSEADRHERFVAETKGTIDSLLPRRS